MSSTVVIGAGAIGGLLAARLFRSGQPVLLLARPARAAALQRDGLVLEAGLSRERLMVPVAADAAGRPEAGLVVLATKLADLPAALELAAPVVGPRTALLTVQNGVEAHDLVASRFPRAGVIASRVHGFFELDGNRVRHVGVAPSLVYGLVGSGHAGQERLIGEVLARGGITATATPAILAGLWEKFLLAASVGAVGLALGIPAGSIRHDPAGWRLLAQAMAEVERLARARGVDLPPGCTARTLDFVAGFPPDATTSLQRDVEARRKSEYDALPGAVLRLADDAGVAVPCHRGLDRRIRERWF